MQDLRFAKRTTSTHQEQLDRMKLHLTTVERLSAVQTANLLTGDAESYTENNSEYMDAMTYLLQGDRSLLSMQEYADVLKQAIGYSQLLPTFTSLFRTPGTASSSQP